MNIVTKLNIILAKETIPKLTPPDQRRQFVSSSYVYTTQVIYAMIHIIKLYDLVGGDSVVMEQERWRPGKCEHF